MMSDSGFGAIAFDLPKNQSNVIKVIGVGGGGSNAINHMFKQGIKGVDFIVCNTDSQALENSSVPVKIQLGANLTEGLGAGANPDVGQQSAIESIAEIESMLDGNTKMIFITAGMGGGTGTGAAPVIAQLAKEREILTVGIVTLPFSFEGKIRAEQALIGIEKLRKQVDSLIVINNNKLREVYGNLGFKAGFSKADEVLATASRGIAEVITHHYTQNIDLRDAKTVLSNSGTAIMGSAIAEGDNRAKEAIISALDSPLLNDNKITGAKNVLLLIVSGSNEITLDEIGEINDHIQAEAGFNANIIMGVGEDESLGNSIAVTIIATGFDIEQQKGIVNTTPTKIIHTLEDEQKSVYNLSQNAVVSGFDFNAEIPTSPAGDDKKIVFELIDEQVQEPTLISKPIAPTIAPERSETKGLNDFINNLDVTFEIVSPLKATDFTQNSFYNHNYNESQQISNKINTQEQTKFTFDLPVKKQAETKLEEKKIYNLTNDTLELKVNQAIQFIPVTELSENGIIKHSLEEYMEDAQANSKLNTKTQEQEIPEEMKITMRQVDHSNDTNVNSENVSPMEMTIEETLRLRADERRKKLKEFNYKFNNNDVPVDQYEKIPAYKRLGIEITDQQTSNSNSRISVGKDLNNDLQMRSNNSYLHDNVD